MLAHYVGGCPQGATQKTRRDRTSGSAFFIFRKIERCLLRKLGPSRSKTDYMWIVGIVNANSAAILTHFSAWSISALNCNFAAFWPQFGRAILLFFRYLDVAVVSLHFLHAADSAMMDAA